MKKQVLLYVLLISASFVLDTKVMPFGIRPDTTALLCYYFGLRNGPIKGIVFGALVGILSDSLSGDMLGPGILGKGMVGYFSPLLCNAFFRWTPLVGLMGLAVMTAFDRAVSFGVLSIVGEMPSAGLYALFQVTGPAVMNSIAGLFLKPVGR